MRESLKTEQIVTRTTMAKSTGMSSEVQLLISVSGIYFFYLYYGILQEKIYKHVEDDGQTFTYSLFLLLSQCIVNCIVAMVGVKFLDGPSTSTDFSTTAKTAPGYLTAVVPKLSGNVWMAVISFTYLTAMGSSNQALSYVNYPTQALGKSCKMIPIMLANVLVGGKKYSLREYLCVLSITSGIVLFRLAKGSKSGAGENSSLGLFLLFASLCLDGLTGSSQSLFRKEYNPSTYSMMFQTNVYAVGYLVLANLVTGQGIEGLNYCISHPHILSSVLQFSLCSALGQIFIFFTITGPGPLVCSTITTTRKFFTILISVFLNPNNHLNGMQWGGVGLVFLGLSGEVVGKYQERALHAKIKDSKE
jgi:solute carrier family 35 (UDP-galactose transporter), member B1